MSDDHVRERCECCGRKVAQLDFLYGCCGACAWCQSLGHCEDANGEERCCHGKEHAACESPHFPG